MSDILTPIGQLKCQISGVNSLNGSLSGVGSVPGTVSPKINRDKYYTGTYEVTPKADVTQVLPTADKTLTDDITVHKVPFYEAHNEHGTTAYIAMEVN